MKKFLKFISPAITLAIICLCVGLCLATTNALTEGPIAEQEAAEQLADMQSIFPEGDSFEEIQLDESTQSTLIENDAEVEGVYIATTDSGEALGYVVISSASGYAGDVTATVGIDTDSKVIAVSLSAPDDTPGLGLRVQEDDFEEQFSGIDSMYGVKLSSSSSEASSSEDSEVGGENASSVDAISGATISSNAATEAVNSALRAYNYLAQNGGLS